MFTHCHYATRKPEMTKVNFFHIGPQKSGTTWKYRAIKDHPQVETSPKDSVHYFNMHYHKGVDWYHDHFANRDKLVIFDSTPS